jgi:hypothetical protein
VYPSPVRISPRPKKDEQRGSGKTGNRDDKSLLERVRKLELIVLNLGGSIPAEDSVDVGVHPPHEEASTEDSTEIAISQERSKSNQNEFAQVEQGLGKLLIKDRQSRYLSGEFWIGAHHVCNS